MERTTNRQKKRTGAFTLAEFLVVIAIITILAGVSFVAAIRYQRRLRRMEMDHTAKEIFLAAQNQLSLESANGSIERLLKESTDDPDDKLGSALSDGLYYILYQADAESNENESIRERLLPFGSIDETVRTDGNYIIIYEPAVGMVRTVWYSEQYTFAATDLSDEKFAEAAADPDKRERYGDAKRPIGYYAGDTITNPGVNPTEKPAKPELTLINDDVLYAKVQDYTDGNASLRLWIEGASSHAKGYVALTGSNSLRVISVGTSGLSLIILDDISLKGARFADLSKELQRSDGGNNTAFIPGEDILVYAEAFTQTTSAMSDIHRTNSLFENVKSDKIEISSIRHLENLDKRISEFNPDSNAETIGLSPIEENPKTYAVAQQTDLFWDRYRSNVVEEIHNKHNSAERRKDQIAVYYYSGSKIAQSQSGCFASVDPTVALTYDGNGHSIENVQIKPLKKPPKSNGADNGYQTYATGMFGEVSKNLTVQNLKLVHFDVTSRTSAGALIGLAKGTGLKVSVRDVLTEYAIVEATGDKPATDQDKQVDAGAVIGAFQGEELSMTKTMAANIRPDSYVAEASQEEQTALQDEISQDSSDDAACKVQSRYGEAGGLIGSVRGNFILSGCAASVYVDAKHYAGGLVGHVVKGTGSQKVRIENSYVGAHTVNGEFLLTEPPAGSGSENLEFKPEAGRYNIVSRNNYAGGLAAAIPAGSEISHSYVTASVYAKGKSWNDDPKKLGFVAEYQTGKETYVLGDEAKMFAYCYSSCVVNGEKVSSNLDALGTLKGKKAFHYDASLSDSYPMPTVLQLLLADPETKESVAGDKGQSLVTDKVYPKFASVHVGDWMEPEKPTETGLKLKNKNRLWVDYVMDMPTETKYLSIAITGEFSQHTAYCLVKLNPQDIGKSQYKISADVETLSKMRDGTQSWGWEEASGKDNKRLEITTEDSGKIKVRLIIDNKAFSMADYEYLCPDPVRWTYDYLTAGENITVRASEDSLIPGATDPEDNGNSFFETLTPDGAGYKVTVSNCRNLINLNFCENLNITSVEQTDNILWDTDDTVVPQPETEPYCKELSEAYGREGVVIHHGNRAGGGFTQAGSFMPIESQTLRSYDGKEHVIAKLTIDNLNWGNKNSALFESTSHLNISNLYMKDPVMRSKNNAAAVVAAAGTYANQWNKNPAENLQLTNVHVYGDETSIRGGNNSGGLVASAYADKIEMNDVSFYGKNAFVGTISGDGAAGGLVGFLKTSGVMTLENSMFSGYLDGSQKPDSVGGLIGKLDLSRTISGTGPNMDDVKIQDCYVGGRNYSYQGEADEALRNQEQTSIAGKKFVGGLIGFGEGPLQILDSFSMAGVYGYGTGTGGLIGCYQDSDNLLLRNCYFGGSLVMKNSGPDYKAGIMIGQVVAGNGYGGWTLQTDFSGQFSDCAYISRRSFAKSMKLVGSVDGTTSISGVKTCSGTDFSAIETSEKIKAEPYDTSLPETYPYKIWTTENGEKIYRGDWIQ